jgi:integrase
MASIRRHGNRWQVRVRRHGYPDQTKSFQSQHEAEKWARSIETEIDKGQFVNIHEAQRTTFSEVIERYLAEVTPSMKGAADDTIRLKAIMRRPIARWSMANLSAARIAAYRDERLKEVGPGTVIRELAYLSAIINHARREWGIRVPNPVQMVRKSVDRRRGFKTDAGFGAFWSKKSLDKTCRATSFGYCHATG